MDIRGRKITIATETSRHVSRLGDSLSCFEVLDVSAVPWSCLPPESAPCYNGRA